jgi:hypothetical protein
MDLFAATATEQWTSMRENLLDFDKITKCTVQCASSTLKKNMQIKIGLTI